jgi:hypothetical protein
MIKKIRSEQKISIDTKFKDWINNQNIEWKWSSKNTLEQNEKSERFDVLLIEKTRCIREFFKLFENLYSECYLLVVYLLNRTSMIQLNWDSSLIRLQPLFKKSIKWKLDHLKIFNCKTYVLLKDANVSSRSEKMKARAFVDYLIDYDFINIFRIWNFEKDDVNDYKNVIFDEKFIMTHIINKISLESQKRRISCNFVFIQSNQLSISIWTVLTRNDWKRSFETD